MKTIMAHNAAVPVEDVGNCNIYGMAAMFIGLNMDLLRYAHPVNPQPPKYGSWAAEVFAFRDAVENNGGRIHTETAVKKIIIENEKVTGIVVEHHGREEHIETDLVICNIPPSEALRAGILDEKQMPREWKGSITWATGREQGSSSPHGAGIPRSSARNAS